MRDLEIEALMSEADKTGNLFIEPKTLEESPEGK